MTVIVNFFSEMVNFRLSVPSHVLEMPLFFILILTQLTVVLTLNCVKVDKCSCKMDDDSGTIDLSKLGNPSGTGPLIEDQTTGNVGDPYQYSFNPCYPFDEGDCNGVAGCQIDPQGGVYYDIGNADNVDFSYDGSGQILTGTYTASDGARQSVVSYQCDPNKETPDTAVHGELNPSTYTFAIVSKYACPQSEPGPGPGPDGGESEGLSPGSILLIIFFAFVFVYLVSGIIFNKLYRKESGANVVPNVGLWGAVPGLVKEGFRFSLAKVRRSEYEPIK